MRRVRRVREPPGPARPTQVPEPAVRAAGQPAVDSTMARPARLKVQTPMPEPARRVRPTMERLGPARRLVPAAQAALPTMVQVPRLARNRASPRSEPRSAPRRREGYPRSVRGLQPVETVGRLEPRPEQPARPKQEPEMTAAVRPTRATSSLG